MTCQVVLWFEALYLVVVGLISWRIAKLQTSTLVFMVSAVEWSAAGFVLFWIVEFIALAFATGGYARENGWCPVGSTVLRLGQYALIWIPVFALACIWARTKTGKKLSGDGAQE